MFKRPLILVLVAAALAAAAVAVVAGAAGAEATFTDPAGDSGAAPDITACWHWS
jgi:hypothetical protein